MNFCLWNLDKGQLFPIRAEQTKENSSQGHKNKTVEVFLSFEMMTRHKVYLKDKDCPRNATLDLSPWGNWRMDCGGAFACSFLVDFSSDRQTALKTIDRLEWV